MKFIIYDNDYDNEDYNDIAYCNERVDQEGNNVTYVVGKRILAWNLISVNRWVWLYSKEKQELDKKKIFSKCYEKYS